MARPACWDSKSTRLSANLGQLDQCGGFFLRGQRPSSGMPPEHGGDSLRREPVSVIS
jgi:hypothetical protein